MQTKTISGHHEVKDADKGIVTIQFAKYDVVDAHGDVHKSGAFQDGAPILVSSYGHGSWKGQLPVGRGTIKDGQDGPKAELQFFMNTTAGRDTFETVKATGELQQWSYGYDTKEESFGEHGEGDDKQRVRFLLKQHVYEVSPVLLGAGGTNTGTIDVKSLDDWYTKKNYSREQRDEMAGNGQAMPDGSFPIKDEEDLRNAIRLAGNASNPEAAKRHIRKRARALGLTDMIPEDWGSGKMRMFDQCLEVVTSIKHLADRAEEIVALRVQDGKKGLGDGTESMIELVDAQLKRFRDLLAQAPKEDTTEEDLATELLGIQAWAILDETGE